MNYFISDTHWGDTELGIIAFEKRPFKDQKDMIDIMIDEWNSVVKDEDTVWHLGDVFFGLERSTREHILGRLNGHKRLILGNHDREYGNSYWRSLGFEEVYDYPIIFNDFYILSHEPLYMTVGPYVNIFGMYTEIQCTMTTLLYHFVFVQNVKQLITSQYLLIELKNT